VARTRARRRDRHAWRSVGTCFRAYHTGRCRHFSVIGCYGFSIFRAILRDSFAWRKIWARVTGVRAGMPGRWAGRRHGVRRVSLSRCCIALFISAVASFCLYATALAAVCILYACHCASATLLQCSPRRLPRCTPACWRSAKTPRCPAAFLFAMCLALSPLARRLRTTSWYDARSTLLSLSAMCFLVSCGHGAGGGGFTGHLRLCTFSASRLYRQNCHACVGV